MSVQVRTPYSLKKPLLVSFLITASLFLGSLIMYFRLQPIIPLFYSLPRESQYLVSKEWLFVLPIFSLVISFGHLSIGRLLTLSEEIIIKLFAWATLVMQVLLFLAWLRIILIVT